MTNQRTLINLGVLALIWGSSFLWIKIALESFTPVQISLARGGLGAAALLLICLVRRIALPTGRKVWLHLVIASFFANAFPFVLFGLGEQSVDSSMAGVLNATVPLWTLLLGVIAGQQRRLGAARIAGLIAGFAGVVVIFAPWQSTGGTAILGALSILLACVCYGIGAIYVGKYLAGRGTPPAAMSAAQLSAAAGWATLGMPLGGLHAVHWQVNAVIAVLFLGILGTGIAVLLFNKIITEEGPAVATTVTYLMPVVGVLLGAIVLGEEFNLRIVAGMVIVLAGIALTRKNPRPVLPRDTVAGRESQEALG